MKNVVRVVIQTARIRYQFTIPDLTSEQARKLIADAKLAAHCALTITPPHERFGCQPYYIFEFKNEILSVEEEPLFIHIFEREQEYEYETPTIQITAR